MPIRIEDRDGRIVPGGRVNFVGGSCLGCLVLPAILSLFGILYLIQVVFA